MAAIRVKCKDGAFRTVSGRVGDFVFRVLRDETMLVFYQPKKKGDEKDVSGMDREWTENGAVMDRFAEVARMLNLERMPDTIRRK